MPKPRNTFASEAAFGGLVAGLALMIFEMLVSALNGDPALEPLQLKGALLLGPGALDPDYYPAGPVVLGGAAVHFALSTMFGWLFGHLITPVLSLAARFASGLVWMGNAYGLLLWLVNFHGLEPLMGWAWFTERSHPITQICIHMFFGCTLALYLNRRLALAWPVGRRVQETEFNRPRPV